MNYQKDLTQKLCKKREKAIDEYVANQEGLKELNAKSIVNNFKIYKEQEELDVDNLTEYQQNQLDVIKEKEKREELLKKLPKTLVPYEMYLIGPYYIGDSLQRKDSCIDELTTELIELINERTKIKLDTYAKYLKD